MGAEAYSPVASTRQLLEDELEAAEERVEQLGERVEDARLAETIERVRGAKKPEDIGPEIDFGKLRGKT